MPAHMIERLVRDVESMRAEIDARRHIEESLRESEQRYRTLLEAIPAYVYSVYVQNGRPVSTEHGMGSVAVTGYDPEDYARDPDLWIKMVHPEDQDLVREFAARNLAAEPTPPIEHRIIHRDGGARWVRNTVVQRFSASGRLVRYDGLVEDVTARKQAEQAMRESERVKAIGTLAGGVAHDFNNIVNVIAGSAALIADSALPTTASHEGATRILDAARHASDLTRRLMGVARMSEAGGDSAIGPVDVALVVGNTIELAEPTLTARNVQVVFKSIGRNLRAFANAEQLLNAVMNLLLNAAEAMPRGGVVTVDVSERRTTLPRTSAAAASRRPYVVLRVRDTGHGMSRATLKRVFEPFFTTRDGSGAFGLGLTVARNMVVAWGGWLSVRSREGAGTSFRLLIPKAEMIAALPAPPSSRVGATVLLVDDDADTLHLMRRVLERGGCRVITAEHAAAGVDAYRRQAAEIQVCVVDLLMPAPGGQAVLEEILTRNAQASVIVTSGFSREHVRAALPKGAWSFIQKPIEEEKLLKMVADLAERSPMGSV